jgi:hypothetical protein
MACRLAVLAGFDPRDVVADAGDFPALLLEVGRRDEHGEIRLAARAREGGGDVGFLAGRIFHAEDQHVFRHPAFVARHGRGDAERETFLAEQRVAAVARAEAHDEAFFGEMRDVSVLGIARPRHVFGARGSGMPTECRHFTNSPVFSICS